MLVMTSDVHCYLIDTGPECGLEKQIQPLTAQ